MHPLLQNSLLKLPQEAPLSLTDFDVNVSVLFNPHRKDGFWKYYSNLVKKMFFKRGSMQFLRKCDIIINEILHKFVTFI